MSAGIKELESLIGITLVERTRRVVRFTPLGVRVAQKAQRILRETEELADMVRAAGKPLAGELRMGVIPTIAPFLLPALLPRLRGQWPDLKLYLPRSRALDWVTSDAPGAVGLDFEPSVPSKKVMVLQVLWPVRTTESPSIDVGTKQAD